MFCDNCRGFKVTYQHSHSWNAVSGPDGFSAVSVQKVQGYSKPPPVALLTPPQDAFLFLVTFDLWLLWCICFPNARSDEPVFCSYNFDFNCIPSVKIAHCKQLLHSLDKDQRNSFSECNIIFLVYIYVYLLLYCRLFTKILAVLSSLKYMDDIILWIFLFKCYSVRFTVRQFVYNLFPYFLYNKLC